MTAFGRAGIGRSCTQAVLLAAALLLAACGTPTPYQPVTDGFGYAEQPLETGRYRVSFFGNSLTARETVENYLLYRAAEVTLEKGYDYFIVAEEDVERNTQYRTTYSGVGAPFGSFYGTRYRGRFYGGGLATATSRPISSYEAYANILLLRGEKPADNPQAYDARDVLARLDPSIVREAAH